MAENLFLRKADEYKRNIDPIKQYIEQNSSYIASMKGISIEEAKLRITQHLKKEGVIKDPIVELYERENCEDKHRKKMKLSAFHAQVKKRNLVLAPTYTAYLPASTMESKIVKVLTKKTSERSVLKKKAFKAKMAGDKDGYAIFNAGQDNKKRFSNSVSGAFGQSGSVLYNETGHSTLTSIVRTESSVCNASNEKCISGNRYYPNADVILHNLISICSSVDNDLIRQTAAEYSIKYPTVQDVDDCIMYSHNLYIYCQKSYQKVKQYIEKLSPEQRFAFVYIGDLYHLRKHNPGLTDSFVSALSAPGYLQCENPLDKLYSYDEAVLNLASYICFEKVKGYKERKDYPQEVLFEMVGSCDNVVSAMVKYKNLIKCLFLTDNMPASTAYIKTQPRRAVVLSDTDSTMFSVDEWVNWKFKSYVFSQDSVKYAAAVMFIATQCMAHQMAMFSANMNVDKKMIFEIQMKPEYFFPVFGQTPVAKHYFTFKVVQEGNVFKEPDFEIKGVHMKNSAYPASIRKESQNLMKNILLSLYSNKKINLISVFKEVISLEERIYNSILNGKIDYFKGMTIKPKTTYKAGPLKSNYAYHQLWLDAFQEKYGYISEPAYRTVKIPLTTDTAKKTNDWLMQQPEDFRKRMQMWMQKHNKDKLPTIYINKGKAMNLGVPVELLPIIDTRRVILDMTLSYRLILSTLGYFPKDKWMVKELTM